MSVNKDIHRLIRTVGKLTDGQARVCDLDWDNGEILGFRVQISPNSGLYKGGRFKFKITLPDDYASDSRPVVRCETDIFHPNIDTKNTEVEATESNVCLDLFSFGEWKKKFGFENIVAGLVYLLYNPNLDSPLCSYYNFDLHVLDYARDDDESFKTKVQMYMRVEEVDGIKFSPDFLNEDNDRVDNYTVDNLDELGVDEETVEPGDSYEGCTMLTVENVELNDDDDDDDNGMESETILVPREAAQCSAGMKSGVFKADLVFENNDDASDDGGLSMTFYFQAFYDRLWQLLPSLGRLSLSNIFYRAKHSFIRSR